MTEFFAPFSLQDYHWWWRSFIVSGGSAVYVFFYSIFYFHTKVSCQPLGGNAAGRLLSGWWMLDTSWCCSIWTVVWVVLFRLDCCVGGAVPSGLLCGWCCSVWTVVWVVNVGHKLVLFRLDCCVCGECWTQAGAVPSGLLCVWWMLDTSWCCSVWTVVCVVNVGHKLVLFRLDCCVCGECWTQAGAVPSGLLYVCPAQSGSLHSSCSSACW